MKEKFRSFSRRLDLYIETKRFRWLKSLILALGFTVTGCVCFLAGFFLNRDENMIYKSHINAMSDAPVTTAPSTQEESESTDAAVTGIPEETEPVTETTPARITIDEKLLKSYISEDISVPYIEYSYTDKVSFENRSNVKGIKLPLTKKSFTLTYNGTISAGIDSSLITASADNDTYTIYVSLPEAHIISHTVHEDSFSVSDAKNNIFNPITPEDYTNLCSSQSKKNEEKALADGLLSDVYSEAERIISDYLKLDGIISSMYTIEFILP